MFRNTFLILVSIAAIFGSACRSVENANANVVNKSAAAVETTNVPPEFSGKITNEQAADPNAPKATAIERGATPIPGIPSEEELKKQMSAQPKNTPPIPGIPSEAELRKQMNTPISNGKIKDMKPPTLDVNANAQGATERPRKNRTP